MEKLPKSLNGQSIILITYLWHRPDCRLWVVLARQLCNGTKPLPDAVPSVPASPFQDDECITRPRSIKSHPQKGGKEKKHSARKTTEITAINMLHSKNRGCQEYDQFPRSLQNHTVLKQDFKSWHINSSPCDTDIYTRWPTPASSPII